MNSEPAVIIGAINAVLMIAIAYGFKATPQQVGQICAGLSLVLAFYTRSKVSPARKP